MSSFLLHFWRVVLLVIEFLADRFFFLSAFWMCYPTALWIPWFLFISLRAPNDASLLSAGSNILSFVFCHLKVCLRCGGSFSFSYLELIALLGCVDCFSWNSGSFMSLFLQMFFLSLSLLSFQDSRSTWCASQVSVGLLILLPSLFLFLRLDNLNQSSNNSNLLLNQLLQWILNFSYYTFQPQNFYCIPLYNLYLFTDILYLVRHHNSPLPQKPSSHIFIA